MTWVGQNEVSLLLAKKEGTFPVSKEAVPVPPIPNASANRVLVPCPPADTVIVSLDSAPEFIA